MYFPTITLTSDATQYVQTLDSHYSPPPPRDDHFRARTPHDRSSFKFSVEDILQIILKSRKSWKTLRGQSEAVWPPYLEATMLKALQEYEPDDSRETRLLGRYPMRNRFISDYIQTTTGKYRSAKQVGSRLQQLRDTPEGRELIDVLTRCYRSRMNTGTCNARVPFCQPISRSPSVSDISCDSSSTTSSGPPVTPTSPVMSRFPLPKTHRVAEPRMPVYIDILPQQSYLSSIGHALSPAFAASASRSLDSRPSDAARHIRNIDATVTFVSPSPVKGKSSYIVLLEGAPVHSEDTTLEYVGPCFSLPISQSPGEEPTLYNTALVPKYWDVICEATDPTLYTIIQDVYRVPDPVPNQDYSQRPRPVRIFSATYHFRYPSSADTTPSSGQSPMEASGGGSAMTPAFGGQTLQGSMPVELTHASAFATPSTYTTPTSEGLRTPTQTDQNLFDEPFMLDVNFDQVAFDDFVSNMDNASDCASSHFFTKDTNTFFM